MEKNIEKFCRENLDVTDREAFADMYSDYQYINYILHQIAQTGEYIPDDPRMAVGALAAISSKLGNCITNFLSEFGLLIPETWEEVDDDEDDGNC